MDHYRAAELALQDERPREAMQHAQACLDAGEERLRAACLDIMRRACQAMDRCTVTVQERGREVVLRLAGDLGACSGADWLVGALLIDLARKGHTRIVVDLSDAVFLGELVAGQLVGAVRRGAHLQIAGPKGHPARKLNEWGIMALFGARGGEAPPPVAEVVDGWQPRETLEIKLPKRSRREIAMRCGGPR